MGIFIPEMRNSMKSLLKYLKDYKKESFLAPLFKISINIRS